ncbi:transglycosylase SLT domain-containing protein, partial [Falsiroseomonas sp. CW058]|uniref:transglycosylase SLT domain-containing protein n=1 Tax=Falsiroseomonas sp. CW058 TaxID=3388664 RepID=UPI003D31C2DA
APPRPAPLPEIGPEVLAALQTVAVSRPADRVLLFALASRESRFDADARNPASSARGLMQFTRSTWLEVVRDHGPAHGLGAEAAALATDPDSGEISARDPSVLAAILALRDDPFLSTAMAMARIERERAPLARLLGREVTEADLYLVHFLGPLGARRFLREMARAPSRRASDIVGAEALEANRSVFVTRKGRHLSLGQVHAGVRGGLRAQAALHARLLERDVQRMVQVAEAR